MDGTHFNAFGEPIDPTKPSKVYFVPEDERVDHDNDPDADALEAGDNTGDDLDGWKPGDPI